MASQSHEEVFSASAVDEEAMSVLLETQVPSTQIVTYEASSDYSDFASDEEDIINHLLTNAIPSSASAGASLLVTDIEDYEEPKGVRLPKVLGVQRSPYKWLPQIQVGAPKQTLRDGCPSNSTHPIARHPTSIMLTY